MSILSSRPRKEKGRSTGRRDLLVVSAATVVVFGIGILVGAFTYWEVWLENRFPAAAPDLFGLLLVTSVGAAAYAALRSRAAKRENRLRAETELRFQAVVEQVPAVTYTWDPTVPTGQAAPVYVSPQLERMLGYSPAEWSENPLFWVERLHPDDRERVLVASDAADRSGAPFNEEYRIYTKDGRLVWIRDEAVVVARDDQGRPLRVQGVMFDITRPKQAELRLLQAESRYRTLVEQLPAITYIEDAVTHRITYISPQIEAMFGYTQQEWLADPTSWVRSLDPRDRDRVVAQDLADTGDHWSVDYRTITRDGHELWVHNAAVLVRGEDGAPLFWQGVVFDITERKAAEGRLREAQERYRTLVEQLPVAVYMDAVDELSTALYISPQYERITGYSAEQRMGDPELWVRMLHPDDRETVLEESARTNATGDPFDIEYRILASDGRVVWLHDHAFLATGPDGVQAWQGVLTDITEHKAAEQQLQAAEERFRAIVEHIPSAIYLDMPDTSLRTLYVSPQIEDITGISPQDWTSRPEAWIEAIDPGDRDSVMERYSAALRDHRPWSGEYRIRTRDGRTIWVRDETTFLNADRADQVVMLGVMSDITERKLAEQALRESEQREREAAERLRALDEMKNTFLAAVSHELRSPLTSILGLSLTLERAMDMTDADRADLLDRLAANARKLDRLLKDLLDIDRLNRGIVEPQYRVADVGAIARRTVETLDPLADREVLVDVESVVISVDPAKVERIVENLLINAARHTTADRRIWLRVEPSEGGALIMVEDDGDGVPADLRSAIFEPFRQGPTASPHSPGTGIGLSLVTHFSELHGGRAWVQDRRGGGASFRVFLPAGPSTGSGAKELLEGWAPKEALARGDTNGDGDGHGNRHGNDRAVQGAVEPA